MARYPGAHWHPSSIHHPDRSETRGIVIHWTAGHEAGDISTLDGPNVDVQFYVDKAGRVYQFLDDRSSAWHAFHTANYTCIGIEHEGSGEAWTPKQLAASAKLSAWLCKRYSIPVRHVNPRSAAPSDRPHWRGLFGHRDLAGIDGNDHEDSVPAATGWTHYLDAIKGGGSRHVSYPLWQLVAFGRVLWQKRVKKEPRWVKELDHESRHARVRKLK
jgi:N-acetylmuramoyl-L-alanine amidase